MSVISEDSLWITGSFFTYSLYSSINGGASWDLKFTTGNGIDKIYFDKNFGFFGNNFELWKTTNYGNNWLLIPGQNGFIDIFFIDSLKGWKSYDSMRVTTDGGFSWKRQNILVPNSNMTGSFASFSNIGRDTIWGGGVIYQFPNLQRRGVVHLTTNGGLNWFYQIPDTSLKLSRLYYSDFYNSDSGWFYSVSKGIKTITGGDSIFNPILSIGNENNFISDQFHLHQNNPNPFNPSTRISYELKQRGKVLLKVYNSIGKEIATLVDQSQISGNYKVDFYATSGGSGLSSGVYFYSLYIDDEIMDTKKMLFLK
ncbi:MAG: hypothetical protein KDD00_04200 [Ignavibacteriae bacterium]|nr:hypothetical protein [Ignavibacteriota bacterium]